jgi:hypothetical protein
MKVRKVKKHKGLFSWDIERFESRVIQLKEIMADLLYRFYSAFFRPSKCPK